MAKKKRRKRSKAARRAGAASRNKGRRGENQAAEALSGARISRSGEGGPDVQDAVGNFWEVKWWANRFDFLYKIVDQNREDTEGRCLVRGDRREWLVVMPLPTYLKDRRDA